MGFDVMHWYETTGWAHPLVVAIMGTLIVLALFLMDRVFCPVPISAMSEPEEAPATDDASTEPSDCVDGSCCCQDENGDDDQEDDNDNEGESS